MLDFNKIQKVKSLTIQIKREFKKSVESIIEVGRCLHEVRKILERKEYVEYLKIELSMSEFHSHRIELIYLKFKNKKSQLVLNSKPSVLYLIASNFDENKIETLCKGGKVKINNSYKTISELSIKDLSFVKKKNSSFENKIKFSEKEILLNRSKDASREISSILEQLSDWTIEVGRLKESKLKIEHSELVLKYIESVMKELSSLRDKLC